MSWVWRVSNISSINTFVSRNIPLPLASFITNLFLMRTAQNRMWHQPVVHGGVTRIGKAKVARPIATKRPMHFVLKSSLAKGEWSFLKKSNATFIRQLLKTLSARYGLTIYQQSVGGNHVHFLLRPYNRELLKGFLRSFSGRVAQHVTGTKKGKPLGKRFFDSIPFSRIVEWGRGFFAVKKYVLQNQLEAHQLIAYTPRKSKAAPGPAS